MNRLPCVAMAIVPAAAAMPAFFADSPADDIDVYEQKLDQCMAQHANAHPEITSKQRKKACRPQLGPAPHG